MGPGGGGGVNGLDSCIIRKGRDREQNFMWRGRAGYEERRKKDNRVTGGVVSVANLAGRTKK